MHAVLFTIWCLCGDVYDYVLLFYFDRVGQTMNKKVDSNDRLSPTLKRF